MAVVKQKIKVPLAYRGVLIDNKPRRGSISKVMKAFEQKKNANTVLRRRQKVELYFQIYTYPNLG